MTTEDTGDRSLPGKAGEHHGACSICGKTRWPTRKAAKRAAAILHPAEHLTAYPCGDSWHYGHPPPVVLRGVADRHTVGLGRTQAADRKAAELFTLPIGRPRKARP